MKLGYAPISIFIFVGAAFLSACSKGAQAPLPTPAAAPAPAPSARPQATPASALCTGPRATAEPAIAQALAVVPSSADSANAAVVASERAQRAIALMSADLSRAETLTAAGASALDTAMKMPKGSKRSDAEDRARFQLAEANADFLEAQDRKNEYMAEMSAARIAMGALQAARSRLDGARSQVKALDQNAPGCYQSEAATLQGVQKQLDERQQRASAELAKADTLRGSLGEIEAVKTQITDALLRAAKLRSVP